MFICSARANQFSLFSGVRFWGILGCDTWRLEPVEMWFCFLFFFGDMIYRKRATSSILLCPRKRFVTDSSPRLWSVCPQARNLSSGIWVRSSFNQGQHGRDRPLGWAP